MNRFPGLLALSFCELLSACAVPTRQFPTVVPGQLFEAGYINVRAPNSDGWRLVESSGNGMSFAKPGGSRGETLSAQVLMFGVPPAATTEQFVMLVKSGIEKDTDPERFKIIESTTDYTNERGYPCVRLHAIVDDNKAQTSPTTKEQLLLETQALYCRHPVHTNTGFAAIYSHRGRSKYPNLADESQIFIRGIQVPSTNH